ncbi:MAG: hypothetical protein PWP08_165 [Methanofollis sp.]|nr:hypothetical protein [Methanofollis sp.]
MRKSQVDAIVDLAMLVAFVIVVLSSLILFFFLPSGSGGWGHAGTGVVNLNAFLGVTRSEWVDVHSVAGFAFVILVVVHMLLHISYFRNIRCRLFPGKKEICETE